jgi:hypothetical protein
MVPPVEDSASALGYEGKQGVCWLKTGQPIVQCAVQSVMSPEAFCDPSPL